MLHVIAFAVGDSTQIGKGVLVGVNLRPISEGGINGVSPFEIIGGLRISCFIALLVTIAFVVISSIHEVIFTIRMS